MKHESALALLQLHESVKGEGGSCDVSGHGGYSLGTVPQTLSVPCHLAFAVWTLLGVTSRAPVEQGSIGAVIGLYERNKIFEI